MLRHEVELFLLHCPGLLTRCSKYDHVDPEQKKICDAIATASIVSNCAGVDSSKRLVLERADFQKFLETHQGEILTDNEVVQLIQVACHFSCVY